MDTQYRGARLDCQGFIFGDVLEVCGNFYMHDKGDGVRMDDSFVRYGTCVEVRRIDALVATLTLSDGTKQVLYTEDIVEFEYNGQDLTGVVMYVDGVLCFDVLEKDNLLYVDVQYKPILLADCTIKKKTGIRTLRCVR